VHHEPSGRTLHRVGGLLGSNHGAYRLRFLLGILLRIRGIILRTVITYVSGIAILEVPELERTLWFFYNLPPLSRESHDRARNQLDYQRAIIVIASGVCTPQACSGYLFTTPR